MQQCKSVRLKMANSWKILLLYVISNLSVINSYHIMDSQIDIEDSFLNIEKDRLKRHNDDFHEFGDPSDNDSNEKPVNVFNHKINDPEFYKKNQDGDESLTNNIPVTETPLPKTTMDIHGGVQMGVQNVACDTGKDRLELDWDNSTDWEYTCTLGESTMLYDKSESSSVTDCLPRDKVPQPIHTCMKDPIVYDDIPPRGGRHRPIWPVWGEYLYCPPERWVHCLEHGAAVFLYHPCADPTQIERLRQIARSCMRKHIITPYRQLPPEQPFAVVTWGCKIQTNFVDETEIIEFVRAHAQRTIESSVSRDGLYDLGLLHKSHLVSDLQESVLCPAIFFDAEHMKHKEEMTTSAKPDAPVM